MKKVEMKLNIARGLPGQKIASIRVMPVQDRLKKGQDGGGEKSGRPAGQIEFIHKSR